MIGIPLGTNPAQLWRLRNNTAHSYLGDSQDFLGKNCFISGTKVVCIDIYTPLEMHCPGSFPKLFQESGNKTALSQKSGNHPEKI